MKITIISDTHGRHQFLGEMSGDVLIHCGDMFQLYDSNSDDVENMDDWFGRQNFDLILCVGGNHDLDLELKSGYGAKPFKNAVFLGGKSYEYKGVKFYGAPWVPELSGQAFFVDDDKLAAKWAEIPNDTDVLITHTPAAGVLDESSRGARYGCRHLAERLKEVSLRLHCFGHVHESAGYLEKDGTTYINAAYAKSGEVFHFEL